MWNIVFYCYLHIRYHASPGCCQNEVPKYDPILHHLGHDGKVSSTENQVPKYSGVLKGLKNLYKYEGFKGLYKGFYVSLLSQAMATALFFLL